MIAALNSHLRLTVFTNLTNVVQMLQVTLALSYKAALH